MKKKVKKILVNLVVISSVLGIFISPALADKVTLIGEVNDNQEVVADGQVYAVGESAAGDDLVLNYISQKVKVTGRVHENEDGKIIIVEFFEVVDE